MHPLTIMFSSTELNYYPEMFVTTASGTLSWKGYPAWTNYTQLRDAVVARVARAAGRKVKANLGLLLPLPSALALSLRLLLPLPLPSIRWAQQATSPAPEPLKETVVASSRCTEHLPYIVSGYNKWHEVFVGHPAHPCEWTATCGWRFGTSREAKAADVLPQFYKDMCERCFFSERASAKAISLTRVHEDG